MIMITIKVVQRQNAEWQWCTAGKGAGGKGATEKLFFNFFTVFPQKILRENWVQPDNHAHISRCTKLELELTLL